MSGEPGTVRCPLWPKIKGGFWEREHAIMFMRKMRRSAAGATGGRQGRCPAGGHPPSRPPLYITAVARRVRHVCLNICLAMMKSSPVSKKHRILFRISGAGNEKARDRRRDQVTPSGFPGHGTGQSSPPGRTGPVHPAGTARSLFSGRMLTVPSGIFRSRMAWDKTRCGF